MLVCWAGSTPPTPLPNALSATCTHSLSPSACVEHPTKCQARSWRCTNEENEVPCTHGIYLLGRKEEGVRQDQIV